MRSLRSACYSWALLLLPAPSASLSAATATPSKKRWVSSTTPVRSVPFGERDDESLSSYLKILGRSSLLTRKEERLLSFDVQELRRWHAVRADLAAQLSRPPTHSEWSEAVGFAHVQRQIAEVSAAESSAQDAADTLPSSCFEGQLRKMQLAKERMIESNLRLVVAIAKQYAGRRVALQDLIQEGTLGLITAVEKYRGDNPSNAKFASYAAWWIRLSISRAASSSGRTIRLPVRLPALIAQASRTRDAFQQEHGREPSESELARLMGVSQSRLQLVLSSSQSLISLDQNLGKGVGSTDARNLLDTLPDGQAQSPEQQLEDLLRRQALVDTLKLFLSSEEHAVICLSFGIDAGGDGGRRTAEEVGRKLGESPERVATIETRALRKLRGRRGLSDLLKARGIMQG